MLALRARLTLRVQVALVGLILWAAVVIGQAALSARAAREGFARVEGSEATANLDRARAAARVDLDQLTRSTQDWAAWDDPYQRAAGVENDFIEANLHAENLGRMRLSEILLLDRGGAVVASIGADAPGEPARPSPARWAVTAAALPENASGYVRIDDEPFAVVRVPLQPSAGSGPPTGTLVMARSLPEWTLPGLAETSAQQLGLAAPDAPLGVFFAGEDRVVGRAALADLRGGVAAVLTVDDDRPVHATAAETAQLLTLNIAVSGIGVLAICLWALELGVLRPVQRLADGLAGLGRGAHGADALPTLHESRELELLSVELRRAVDALQRAEESDRRRLVAERLSAARGAFLARMSHELRTPLNGVMGMMELLRQSPLDPTQREMTAAVHQSAEALLLLINDVLDLSKVDAGQLRMQPRAVEPAAVLHEVLALLQPIAAQRRLPLRAEVDLAPGLRLRLDPLRLRQVLVNLVGNALKFTPSGSITARMRRVDASFVLEVVDTGPGLAADVVAGIFEPFVLGQAQTPADGGAGMASTGLGLTICREIAALMGGEMGVDSVLGQGSTFWMRVPWEEAEPETEDTPRPATPADAGATQPADDRGDVEGIDAAQPAPAAPPLPVDAPRAVLADDHPTNRLVAQGMLERLGYAVDVAEDGAGACALLATGAYGVALLDLHMPVMDGAQATAILRAAPGQNQHIPVLIVSASDQDEDRARCAEVGANLYLVKPLAMPALQAALVQLGLRSSVGGAAC